MLANPPPPPHTHKRTHTQCKEEKVAFEVCGATFSSQGREVVLFTKHARTAAQQEQELARSKSSKKKDAPEEDAGPRVLCSHYSIFVMDLDRGRLVGTQVDIGVCVGGRPPSFALRETVPVLGSDYIFVGLGLNHLGVFSLASGCLVRDIELDGSDPVSITDVALLHTPSERAFMLAVLTGTATKEVFLFNVNEADAQAKALEVRLGKEQEDKEEEGGS